MIVVVATRADLLAAAGEDLYSLGLGDTQVVAPSPIRRLLLSRAPDLETAQRAVAALRKKGHPAVLRPPSGPRLEAWTRHTEPVTVGERLTVVFAWSEHDRSSLPNVVEIDPAGGFGSAQQPAARLMLEELAGRIAGGERVLDVGCGNGILGLSALRLGAARLSAVDIEPRAVESTRRNAVSNGFGGRVDDRPDGVYDVVLANIGRAALIDLGAELVSRVAPGGWLAVSGFSPPQCDVVAASLRPLATRSTRTSGEWAALVLGHGAEGAE